MGYQYRDPRRATPAALLQELDEAKRRAQQAERALAEQQNKLLDAQLRAREAQGARQACEKHLQQLRDERDQWREKVEGITDHLTAPILQAPTEDQTLEAHDRMISRCRCGSWVYGRALCSHCTMRQRVEDLLDQQVA